MNPDYKSMTDEELQNIISDIRDTASRWMNEITEAQAAPNNYEVQAKKERIVYEYAQLKSRLKEIYHYTQLGRNDLPGHNFYNAYFCPAIRDCYLDCTAKTNERNLSKLSSTFYQIWCNAIYHSDDE